MRPNPILHFDPMPQDIFNKRYVMIFTCVECKEKYKNIIIYNPGRSDLSKSTGSCFFCTADTKHLTTINKSEFISQNRNKKIIEIEKRPLQLPSHLPKKKIYQKELLQGYHYLILKTF